MVGVDEWTSENWFDNLVACDPYFSSGSALTATSTGLSEVCRSFFVHLDRYFYRLVLPYNYFDDIFFAWRLASKVLLNFNIEGTGCGGQHAGWADFRGKDRCRHCCVYTDTSIFAQQEAPWCSIMAEIGLPSDPCGPCHVCGGHVIFSILNKMHSYAVVHSRVFVSTRPYTQ